MRAQDEKIKGFNLLELIVVVVIIGVISAIGYPKFSDWRLDRETRNSVTVSYTHLTLPTISSV